MKTILLALLTILCKPGVLYTEKTKTLLKGDDIYSSYYFNLNLKEEEVYLYISGMNDTVWFYQIDEKLHIIHQSNKNILFENVYY